MATNNPINAPLPLSATQGGTGLVSPTAHSLLVAEGALAFTALGSATNGQIPIGSTGADPVLATLTQGSGISITNGAGSITIAASGGAVAQSTGTWIPDVKAGGSPTGFSYSSRSGSYVLTGKWCQVTAIIALSARPTGTTAVTIDGLPFTADATDSHSVAVAFSFSSVAGGSSGKYCEVQANTNSIYLYFYNGSSVYAPLPVGDLGGSSTIRLSVGYYTA